MSSSYGYAANQRFLKASDFSAGWLKGYGMDILENSGANWGQADFDKVRTLGGRIVRAQMSFRFNADGSCAGLDPQYTSKFANWMQYSANSGLYMVPCPFGPASGSPFWNDTLKWKQFLDCWATFIDPFRNNPWLGGVEIINEPDPNTLSTDNLITNPFMEVATKYLRRVCPNHVIFPTLSFGSLAQAFANVGSDSVVSDANTVYIMHWYSPHEISHRGVISYPIITYPSGAYTPQFIYNLYRPVVTWQQRTNKALFISEWSISRYDPASDQPARDYMNFVIEFMDRQRWAWLWLSYKGFTAWRADTTFYDVALDPPTYVDNAPRLNILRNAMGVASVP